jgi:hypothetical protein
VKRHSKEAAKKEPVDDPRVQAIAAAAKDLVEKRDRWLNPEGATEAELKKRTLTNLYNERPTWLNLAHKRLNDAVLDAYARPRDPATRRSSDATSISAVLHRRTAPDNQGDTSAFLSSILCSPIRYHDPYQMEEVDRHGKASGPSVQQRCQTVGGRHRTDSRVSVHLVRAGHGL